VGRAIDPADAVYEYLELFYGIKRIQWMMERSNALDFVTTAAPGLRDLLLIGKVYEIEARKREDGRRMYDLIVVDAPPTGRIVPFLQAPEGVTEIVRVGPIKRQAGQIRDMLTDPHRTQAVIATLLEEMPVRETTEGITALRQAGVAVGPVVANQVVTPRIDEAAAGALDHLDGETLQDRVQEHGATISGKHRRPRRRARAHPRGPHRAPARAARRARGALQRLPVLSLPLLTDATFDADDLEVLADVLALQIGEDGPHAREHLGADLDHLLPPAVADTGVGRDQPPRRRPHRDLGDAVRDAHVLVTTGAGGVGKTTTAAALGLAAARAGRRTLVLTIDPARRLAQAMGLEGLSDEPTQVEVPDAAEGGELWAMMLDMQTTFDRLIDRHATTPEHARNIKANRIYRTLSSTLSGTQEYMAMERLHELHETGEWDLLVVDTPPTRSALDFLDAPKRMTSFLEGRLLSLLMKPGMAAGKRVGKVVGFGATAFMKVAGKVTGMDLLEDLASFFRNFEGMYQGFKERAEEVLALLQRPSSRFVVVTSPEPPPAARGQVLPRTARAGGAALGRRGRQPHPARRAPRPERRGAHAGGGRAARRRRGTGRGRDAAAARRRPQPRRPAATRRRRRALRRGRPRARRGAAARTGHPRPRGTGRIAATLTGKRPAEVA
jgi:anion-transporting  ArsA/GET3 family ATPase